MGLKGEDIPLECRILALADAYDAMTSDRPYRKAMSQSHALAEIKRCTGTQFDPQLAEEFIRMIRGTDRKSGNQSHNRGLTSNKTKGLPKKVAPPYA